MDEEDEIPANIPVPDTFDWAAAAEQVGARPMQVEFAKGLAKGMTATAAYKKAGYGGTMTGASLRSAASQAAKSKKIKQLLSWARAGGVSIAEKILTREDSLKALSAMALHGSENGRRNAIVALEALRSKDREDAISDAADGMAEIRFARDMIIQFGGDGAASVALHLAAGRLALSRFPLLHDFAHFLKRDWPQIWTALVARQGQTMLADLNENLSDPQWQRWQREKIWGEQGFSIGDDNVARRDPQGRIFIAPTVPMPAYDAEAGHGRSKRHNANGGNAERDMARPMSQQ